MLVNLKQMIAKAEEGGYCVPAFNVYNMETVMGVIKAAEELKAPVILQIYPRLINEERPSLPGGPLPPELHERRCPGCGEKGIRSCVFPFGPWPFGAGSTESLVLGRNRYYV